MLLSIILISGVALLLSFEYHGERYRTLLWVFRGISMAAAAAAAVGMLFFDYPFGVEVALGLTAIGANLPLATIGLKRNNK